MPVSKPRPALAAPPTVGFAGRLVYLKGVDVLLRALARVVAQVPAARLLVAGDGPERNRLNRLVGELRLSSHVSMLGHLSREEMERQLTGAWLQAVPSRLEAFALSAAEAMMRGTAVVASGVGGLAEVVCDGHTGLLVPPNDELALATALLRLMTDPALAEQMGRAARARALEYFTEDVCLGRFMELYELLRAGRCRASEG